MTRSRDGTILVVDDELDIRAILAAILRGEGYRVVEAANGAEALQQVSLASPGLILLDMRMPIMDGWHFSRALGERQLDVPVIVMTAAPDARRWAREIGARDYLAKPFEVDDLLAKVGSLSQRPLPAP
jgi:CheY-like chemotaxis protein